MSKRTSTIRNSPPSSSPMHKKRKTTNYSTPEITSSLPLEVDSAIGSSNPDIISLLKGSTPSNNGKETPSLGGSSAPIKDGHSPPVQADANGWTKVEKRKEKKAKKVAQKALNEPPSFAFNVQQLAKMQTVAISVCIIFPNHAQRLLRLESDQFAGYSGACTSSNRLHTST